MRIVFDASAHYKNCPSLNDVLHQGPLMLPDMVGMLLRFRAHNIAVISDVEKAFLQVRLQEIDRDTTRCLWVRDVTRPVTPDNIIIYRFTRVTFGLNTSPFLLGATIEFHLEQLGATNAMVEEIRGNLYVDNLIYGARTAEDALMKYHQSKRIFDGLNMNLREFMSNDEGFNTCIPAQDRSSNLHPKVLGIHWNTKADRIILKGTMAPRKEVTKRSVSQQLASIFDPLGLLVPLLLPAKVFLQSLWRDEFAWDVTLPPNLHEQWRIISSQVSTFYKELDRQFMLHPDNNCTLFAFSDASQFAIATCVYIGCNENVQLAMAKSKLPSLKASITIPKLEMNALILSARVVNFICKALDSLCRIQEVILFTDSEIVLGWIRSPPARKSVGTLISNRLNELRRIVEDLNESGTECRFGYISTTENPADCGTRGLSADALQNHFWWKGPKLIQNFAATRGVDDVFPMSPPKDESHDETPITTTVASLVTTEERKLDEATLFNLSRFSSLYKAKRAVSYVIRFLSRSLRNLPALRKETILKNIPALKVAASTFELKGDELREAKRCLIRDHQTVIVSEHRIKSQKNLNIQKDEDGILRCYGRLQHADLSTPTKTPIYIAPKTALARLIILEAHGHYHSGVAHTMAKIRENYWIPRLRQQVRVIIQKCIPCQKLNNLPFRYPQMEDLPKTRVHKTYPFEHIGLDYFGPLMITTSTDETSKAYGCIFACRTTRLIHLELVHNLTTEAFLNSLRRFFARRGVPRSITCDNAPTFLLGEQIMQNITKQILEDTGVEEALAQREIEWIHITPFAPWQGGFYERLIRSVKYSLYKALGKRTVSFDVLRTTLTEIEGVLNSRPLTYQEEQWDQQPLLRPIDFLQKNVTLNFPFEHTGDEDHSYHTPEEAQQLATQRQVEEALRSSVKLTENFWRIWSSQYLTSLREHHKLHMDNKRGTNTKPQEGEVVLLCDASQPRNMWRIGRIVAIRSNPLDKVREVVIELPNKSRIRRPVNKVVPLEIDDKPTPTPEDDRGTPVCSPPTPVSSLPPQHPYNLRVRRPINYNEREENNVRDESDNEDESEDPTNQLSFSTPHSSLNFIRHVLHSLHYFC